MTYEQAKRIVDLLVETLILKEKDRNIVMDLLMNMDSDN